MLQNPIDPGYLSGFDKLGIVAILVGIILLGGMAFVREWVVPGSRYDEKVAECQKLAEENARLWREKVEDAKESEVIAKAYIRNRERDVS